MIIFTHRACGIVYFSEYFVLLATFVTTSLSSRSNHPKAIIRSLFFASIALANALAVIAQSLSNFSILYLQVTQYSWFSPVLLRVLISTEGI